MARFIRIAWESGDHFTFKVWSEPDGDWMEGHEFTSEIVTLLEETPDMKILSFRRR